MGAGEKKVAIALVVVLVALVAAYVLLPNFGKPPNEMAQMMPPGMAQAAGNSGGKGMAQPAGAKGGTSGAACATGGGEASAKTQEFGKPGARLEIIALLPITHGCHTTTEAELKKIQQKHPNDIHLVIADLFGPDAPKYQQKIGGGQRMLVAINGKTQFELNGKQLVLERQEGMSYKPADLEPLVEQQLKSG